MLTLRLLQGAPAFNWTVVLNGILDLGAFGAGSATQQVLTRGADSLTLAGVGLGHTGPRDLSAGGSITSGVLRSGGTIVATLNGFATPLSSDSVNAVLNAYDASTIDVRGAFAALIGEPIRVLGSEQSDVVLSSDFGMTVYGFGGNDQITGGLAADLLVGGDGNDTLVRSDGQDTLNGGRGDDAYRLGSKATGLDTIVEDSGTDTIYSTISRSLVPFAQVERLVLEGTGNLAGTGNALANTIIGNGGNNTLEGAGGADTLNGGLGNDTYVLADGNDTVVDNGGTDLITSTISRSLAGYAAIENLTLLGSATKGTGNALANTITGNGLNNVLNGGGGEDTLIGGDGDDVLLGGGDTLNGGPGNDTYYIAFNARDQIVDASGIDTIIGYGTTTLVLYPDVENILMDTAGNIQGNALGNYIRGGDGENRFRGGAGNDVLWGRLGEDAYYGEVGSDTFRFASAEEMGWGVDRDIIRDFMEEDTIDLSMIPGTLAYMGSAQFTGTGQIRIENVVGGRVVYINTTGSTAPEGMILVQGGGINTLDENDFLL